MKAVLGKEKFVVTNKLLVDASGKKMGKTEGNVVNLVASAEDMYGKIMTWPESILATAFELCTKMSWEEVKEIQKRLQNTSLNPRDFKMRLAREITKIYHGEKKAAAAEELFVKTFQKGEAPTEITSVKVAANNIVEVLMETKLSLSKGDARRLIEQGGIKTDGKVIKDVNQTLVIPEDGMVIQKGKREFRRIFKS